MRLFCLPYAGAGASIFRGWADALPETVEVVPVQLPGRETRFREAPLADLGCLSDALANSLLPWIDKPFAFFGYSLGALLAFEVLRRLQALHKLHAVRLFVSACVAPQGWRPKRLLHRLPKPEFLAELRQLNGTPEAVFHDPELVEMLLPMLRADFTLCERYQYSPGPALRCPITALGGLQDDSTPRKLLAAWGEQTTEDFHVRFLPGAHFFLHTAADYLLRILGNELVSDTARNSSLSARQLSLSPKRQRGIPSLLSLALRVQKRPTV